MTACQRAIGIAVGALLVLLPMTAQAGPDDSLCGNVDAAAATIAVAAGCKAPQTGPTSGSPGSSGLPLCPPILTEQQLAEGIAAWEAADPATRPKDALTTQWCDPGPGVNGTGYSIQLTGTVAPNATDLVVASARSQLALDVPDIATSPPRGGTQLLGVPIWFWARAVGPVATTASIPGLSATLTATPGPLTIEIGDGPAGHHDDLGPIRCPDAGTAYDPARHHAYEASTCSHAFDWNGTYTITAGLVWHLAWAASNGQRGTLPDVARTTAFTLTVQEGRAVTD